MSAIRKLVFFAVLICIVIMAIVYKCNKHSLYTKPIPGLNVVIVTQSYDSKDKPVLTAYDCRSARYYTKHIKMDTKFTVRMGHSRLAAGWPRSLIIHSENKTQYERDINHGLYCDAVYYSGCMYMLSYKNGIFAIKCYDITGKLVSSIEHYVACADPKNEYESSLEVTDKWIAIMIYKKNNNGNASIILLDHKGKQHKFLKRGYNPQFSINGSYLAYYTGDQFDQNRSNHIIIYDLEKKRIKLVLSSCPYEYYISETYYLSSNGKCLVLAYPADGIKVYRKQAYAVDISGKELKWYKLPITIDHSDWAVLNKVPDSFKEISKNDMH